MTMQFLQRLPRILAVFLVAVAPVLCQAVQIVVGQVAPLTGPEGGQGRAYAAGMQLFFDSVNKAGGVNGNTFVLVTKDDAGKAEETVNATKQLMESERPAVLAGFFGSRNINAIIASGILDREKISLIGYRAAQVRDDIPRVYNVRASLSEEIRKIAEHLATVGVSSLGLLYETGPDADLVVAAVEARAEKVGAKVISKATYEAGSTRVSDAIDQFIKDRPQAILLICSGAAGASFIERYRANGGAAQVFVHSGADMERITRQIAQDRLNFVSTVMQGVAISQVVPSPYHASRIAKEYSEILQQSKSNLPASYVMLEGFIAAKVIVDVVRRQGSRPYREAMGPTLEKIASLNLGGYVVGYEPKLRSGSRYVELTIISDTGKIRQ